MEKYFCRHGGMMKKYIFKEQKIAQEYKYIFLCGAHYGKGDERDKRNVLRRFLSGQSESYRPVILEDNFIFSKDSSQYLVYDDIHMKDLYQIEMLMNYLSDYNIIIQESISTGAETGLFLSEPNSLKKTCLLLPDYMAVEEDKLGQFIRLAFKKSPNEVKVIKFFPRIEPNIVSSNVKYWHTYFYGDEIGVNLGGKILKFVETGHLEYKIQFVKEMKKVEFGGIHYQIKGRQLEITILPRTLLCCIAALFNIEELLKKVINAESKMLKEYIEDIKQCLFEVFRNSIEEKTGRETDSCSIKVKMNVNGVYIGEIIGMCLYLFQAAGFIEIKKDKNYIDNRKVVIHRKMVVYQDGSKHFFYEKYQGSMDCIVNTQIVV